MSELTEINFDITSCQLLIGKVATAYHIESGGHPADIFSLAQLLNEGVPDCVSFRNANKRPDRWANLSLKDIIEQAQWLMNVADREKSQKSMFVRRIKLSARLGLLVGREAIVSPNRFNSIPEFQRAISADKIIWRDRFKDWDDLDILIHLHNIGEEEKQRPTIPIIDRRIREGRVEPGYRFIRNRIPLPEAYERAGFIFTRDWDKTKHDEWGVMFYTANGRAPTEDELDHLSSQGKGPSSHGVSSEYGGMRAYGKSIQEAAQNREKIKIDDIKRNIFSGNLPRELFAEDVSAKEAIRRAGRYRIINQLLSSRPRMQKVGLSMYDICSKEFVDYLASQDSRIQQWLVEAAALYSLCYPETFPDGEFIKSLRTRLRCCGGLR